MSWKGFSIGMIGGSVYLVIKGVREKNGYIVAAAIIGFIVAVVILWD